MLLETQPRQEQELRYTEPISAKSGRPEKPTGQSWMNGVAYQVCLHDIVSQSCHNHSQKIGIRSQESATAKRKRTA